MDHHDLTLERRLRASSPAIDESAFDAALLARVRAQPVARRRLPRTVAIPAAAGATLTATAVVMLAGGPADVGGPSSASAVTQALRWFDPPAGTVLHTRSVERQGGRTTTHELWEAAGDPTRQRELVDGRATHDPVMTGKDAGGLPAGDPVVAKVRFLLQHGHMRVAREQHGGVDAWAISLKADEGRPVWTLWVSAGDGRPLELRDPGRDADEAPQVIRWPVYEVLRGAAARAALP
jgi:hypothetical protein